MLELLLSIIERFILSLGKGGDLVSEACGFAWREKFSKEGFG